MATLKQQKVAKGIIASLTEKPMTIGEILVDAGYSPKTATGNPQRITQSAGVKESIEQLLARLKIDKQSRLERLAQILYDEDKRSSLGANDQITKMLGEYAPVQQQIDDIRDKRNNIIKPE